jgi:hypothetical protein
MIYEDASARWRTDCHLAGGGGQGAVCSHDDDCQAGFLCIAGNPSSHCAAICNLTTPTGNACPGSPTCKRLGAGAVISTVEYGACL